MARILIVDDQPLNVDLLEQELESLDYETAAAYDGQEALDQVEAFGPDLILLDVMMPVLDGFTVCKILKADPETALIPIIIMTALDDVDDRIQGIEAGADDFLTKPVNERELKARIETALRMRAAMLSRISDAGKKGEHYEKFVPQAVRRRVEANPENPELAKREEDATILFLDIVGYTRLSERLSSSVLSELVERYFSVFIDHLHGYGGDIVESSGDGLMVLFQDPDIVAHANKAVEAARVIFEETNRMNGEGSGPPIALHMGINSGLANVGSTRYQGQSGSRWVFTADGFVVNLAARLASVAEAGELCVAPETAKRLAELWDFEDLGPKAMKNVGEPTRVFRMRGRRTVVSDKASLVVLPLDNLDGTADHVLIAEGLAEDLTADFSRIEGLLVIAAGSARKFAPSDDPAQICTELGVDMALVGSLCDAETGVRLETRLVSCHGKVEWHQSQRFAWDDMFDARDRIVREVANALELELTEADRSRLDQRVRVHFGAWKQYRRAVESHLQFTRESNALALRRLDMALRDEPSYARALAIKSRATMLHSMNDWGRDPKLALQEAHVLALASLQADPNEAMAHISVASVLLWMRQHDEALEATTRALETEPSHAPAFVIRGSIRHYMGDHETAIGDLRHAMRLDPKAPSMYMHILAQCQYSTGRYEEAKVTLNRRLSQDASSDVSRVLLAACYGQLGQRGRAVEQWDEALAINPSYSLEKKRSSLPYQDPAEFEHFVEGLTKAGLPH